MRKREQRIWYRLRKRKSTNTGRPVFAGRNIHYEVAERDKGTIVGGIGVIQRLVQRVGLAQLVDSKVRVLQRRAPYHESDHVLNIAYNLLGGGDCLEDLSQKRNDEAYMDALGAARIPHPTTAGDFCRRFGEEDVASLMEVINEARLRVWKQQDEAFFDEAFVDMDSVITETVGKCKEGIAPSYKGIWGYHPAVISLRNTQEPLFILNRSGNRPSYDGVAPWVDKTIEFLFGAAGFRRITIRGDTAFSQTTHLDRWDAKGVRFIFGYNAVKSLISRAGELAKEAWLPLKRRPKYKVQTTTRTRPENVKARIVKEREYKTIRLVSEHVAEFSYKPLACKKSFRMVVLRKSISVERGQNVLFPETRYLFYITNNFDLESCEIVYGSNARCDQENLIAQLKNGVPALKGPLNSLTTNWAYMVIASLAWTLKCWFALLLPTHGNGLWTQKYQAERRQIQRMEFKKFVNYFMLIPVQVVKAGRRIVLRLLSWNRFQHILLRVLEVLEIRTPLRC